LNKIILINRKLIAFIFKTKIFNFNKIKFKIKILKKIKNENFKQNNFIFTIIALIIYNN